MNWKVKSLQDVCEKITDGTHQTPTYFPDGIVFLSSKNVTTGKIDWESIKYIDEAQHLELHKRVAPKIGDILLAKNGTTGVAAIVDRDIVFDIYVSLAWLRPKGEITSEYLLQFINSPLAKKQFNSRLKGIGVPNLHLKEIKEVKIPIPPLSEQQAIVEKLDAAFALIDQAKANIEKNIQNAKELFQSKLNQIFSQKGEGWEERKLGEVCKIIGGGTPSKNNKSFYDGEIPWITVRDMKADLISETEFSITELAVKKSATNIIHKGNVIIATRVSLGKICIVDRDSAINQDLKGIIPKINIEKRILFWWFKSIAKFIENSGVGLTVKGVKLEFVNNLIITFPKSLQTQQEIVSQLDALSEQTKQLETKYQAKLGNLEELRKSILEKAFKGELVQMSESQISSD